MATGWSRSTLKTSPIWSILHASTPAAAAFFRQSAATLRTSALLLHPTLWRDTTPEISGELAIVRKVHKLATRECHYLSQAAYERLNLRSRVRVRPHGEMKSSPGCRNRYDRLIEKEIVAMKILSLEDDHAQSELIQIVLSAEGHEVQTVREGSQAIRYLESATADLLILDWQVSDISGLEVLGWVRERIGRKLPVLFLTNRTREDETITALNAGADDYMIKPVRRRELVARVNALLRRAYPPVHRHETLMTVGRYTIDFHARTVSFDEQVMGLTTKEFDVTAVLFRNLGRVMPRDMLVKMIWG